MYAQGLVHHLARKLRLVHRVDRLRHDRDACELAVHIRRGEQFLGRLDATLLELSNRVGKLRHRLMQRWQPWKMSNTRGRASVVTNGQRTPGKVAIFATCCVNYNEPGIGHD